MVVSTFDSVADSEDGAKGDSEDDPEFDIVLKSNEDVLNSTEETEVSSAPADEELKDSLLSCELSVMSSVAAVASLDADTIVTDSSVTELMDDSVTCVSSFDVSVDSNSLEAGVL